MLKEIKQKRNNLHVKLFEIMHQINLKDDNFDWGIKCVIIIASFAFY